MRHLLFLFLTFTITSAVAQDTTDWQAMLQRWMSAEEIEEAYSTETLEWLAERAETPLNLNQTTREELEQLPFLNARQVEALVAYLDRYGPMRTLSELQMINEIDYDTRQLLRCFVTAGEKAPPRVWPLMADIKRDGHHTLTATLKLPLYERKGDRNGYLGYKYRHDLRYQFNYKSRIKFGITAAQDAGEPFFSHSNSWGYDHYNYYLQLRDMGTLEALNVGMYRVQLGMGLLMNTSFGMGKIATLQSLGRSSHTLTAHASRSASDYLHGAAATLRLSPSWHITAFASYRPIDATLNKNGSASTLLYDGYHRTPTEMAKKNNTHMTDVGVSAGWRHGTLFLNANAVYTHLDRPLQPQKETALYRRYAAEGHHFFNVSMDYGYTHPRWSIAGETAMNRAGAFAALHSLNFRTSSTITLMAIHRYYDERYTALHARSFSEGSNVQNEHGIYVGATWKPSWAWLLQTYADYAHFSWMRYRVSAPSDAFDTMLSATYKGKGWTADGRFRFHLRQQDNEEKTRLINRKEYRLRLGCTYSLPASWTLRTQTDGVHTSDAYHRSRGIMVSQQASWQGQWLRATAWLGWFHTDDYDSRLYQYEPSVLYDYSFPLYYGHGWRYAVILKGELSRRLTIMAKIGVTDYFDRNTIGSGLQQINASSATDLLFQLRVLL